MDEDNDGNKSMRFGGGCFDSLQLCSYKEIQSNDSAKNFHNTSLKGSYDLGLFLLLEKMRKERRPCLNPPHHTLCRYQQTVFGPPLPTNERVFFFFTHCGIFRQIPLRDGNVVVGHFPWGVLPVLSLPEQRV